METEEGGKGVVVLVCSACPRVSSLTARGWKAYRVEEPGRDDEPALRFYCPSCDPGDDP